MYWTSSISFLEVYCKKTNTALVEAYTGFICNRVSDFEYLQDIKVADHYRLRSTVSHPSLIMLMRYTQNKPTVSARHSSKEEETSPRTIPGV